MTYLMAETVVTGNDTLPACHVLAGMVASYDVRKETVFPTAYRKRFCIRSS